MCVLTILNFLNISEWKAHLYVFFFTFADLQSVVDQCKAFLVSKKKKDRKQMSWHKRMQNVHQNWQKSRKDIFTTVLSSSFMSTHQLCLVCSEEKATMRCYHCESHIFLCPKCDAEVHKFSPFHDREGWCGFFKPLDCREFMDISGEINIVGKFTDILSYVC